MTEKRFKFVHDNVARNLKTPICDNNQLLTLEEVLDKMNELSKENEQIKYRIQKYYDTTNDDGKQILSDLVDSFELDKINTSWFDKGDV